MIFLGIWYDLYRGQQVTVSKSVPRKLCGDLLPSTVNAAVDKICSALFDNAVFCHYLGYGYAFAICARMSFA